MSFIHNATGPPATCLEDRKWIKHEEHPYFGITTTDYLVYKLMKVEFANSLDYEEVPIYFGQTTNGLRRIRTHRHPDASANCEPIIFDSVQWWQCKDLEEMNLVESFLIWLHHGAYYSLNRNNYKWKDEYFRSFHSELVELNCTTPDVRDDLEHFPQRPDRDGREYHRDLLSNLSRIQH